MRELIQNMNPIVYDEIDEKLIKKQQKEKKEVPEHQG